MNREELVSAIAQKRSYLCVGLDTDIEKIPPHLLKESDPVFAFNKEIIDATAPYCVSYKLNTAFYESQGIKGWQSLEKTLDHIPDNIFTIADAKRGDIGNTARHYARTFFETFPFHSVTLSPYMGEDSISPFLEYKDKWVIVLGLTSNKGAADIQMLRTENGEEVYIEALKKIISWGNAANTMIVAGATRPQELGKIRELAPDHFLLVPGVGAQGGDLKQLSQTGLNSETGLLVNSSRSIIYAGSGPDFGAKAALAAKEIQQEMSQILASGYLTI